MNDLQSIFIPCETFAVRVVFAPSDTLTPLGQLLIKAIHAGVRTIPDLDAIFGLGDRPLLRLALDLMNQSIVMFNFSTGEMRLTPQTVAAIENDSLATIGSLDRIEEELVVMRDRVAGTVTLLNQREDRTTSGSCVAANPDGVPDTTPQDVLRAIRRYMQRRTSRAGRPLHAVGVTFELVASPDKPEGKIHYLELGVRPLYDKAANHLQILVESPDNLSWEARDRLERALTSLANRPKLDEVFKNLRNNAHQPNELPGVSGVQQELLQLQELIAGLAATRAGMEAQQQARLERAAAEVAGMVGEQGTSTSARIVIGDDDHVATVREMIRTAARQILIACPFIGYEATWQYREDLEAALQAGRRVFFLLGIGDDYDLPENVGSWLYALKARYPEHLYFTRNSSRCHAKFVVADAADVLLTSYNFLHRTPGEVFELGVRLHGTGEVDGGRPLCPVAAALVRIARDIYADHVDSRRIIEQTRLLGSPNAVPPEETTMPRLPRRAEGERPEFDAERIALWKRDWRRHVGRLARQVRKLGATYRLVRDAEHRKLMYDAIRGAKQRLVILSDQVSSNVLNREFEDALAECTQRGAETVLVFRRRLPGTQEALDRIKGRCGQRLRYVVADADEAVASHAKLVVCDDWAVVTSFNFLAFAGDYEGAERHRTRTELGVLMHGDIVGQLWEQLTTVFTQLQSLAYQPQVQQRPSVAEPVVAEVQRVRNIDNLFVKLLDRPKAPEGSDDERRQIGSILEEWFRDASGWEAAFSELEDLAAVNVPFLEQAIAACMATQPKADEATRKRWTDRLIEEIWMNRADAHVVGLLLEKSSAGGSPSVPPPELVVLTADYRSGLADSRSFESAAIARDDALNATAVAALAIESMLYDADPPHEVLQYIVESDLAPPLRGLSAKALAFRVEHPQGLVGIDLSRLSSNEALVKQQEEAQKQVADELKKCIGLWPTFKLGQLAWSRLRGGEHGFDALLVAAESRKVRTIAAFLDAIGSKDAAELLDDAVSEIADKLPYQNPEIEGNWRRTSVRHLDKLLRAARKWVQTSAKVAGASDHTPPGAVMSFARGVAEEVSVIESLAKGLRDERAYAYPLVKGLRERIDPLVRLAAP
jgi:phosphatidylserine/phosphatidylglycerophosphate/cardiolipin synthase-like enzyme